MQVIERATGKSHYIKLERGINTIGLGSNADIENDTLRLVYADPFTPTITYDYDMISRKLKVVEQRKIQTDFDRKNYTVERLFATAADGEKIPITLIYRKSAKRKGVMKVNGKRKFLPRKMYLTAYGAYGIASEPYFSYSRLSLLDRNFIFAIAHVRGGSDKGNQWYEEGKRFNKKNTFSDFISVAEHLIAQDYIEEGRIVASGGSAGGLLMGAVANARPELFKAVVLNVPFVDVVNTMLNEDLPLTTGEYKEWGNPNLKEDFEYMLSYSPYDNVKQQAYPHMLFTTAINDENVPYWEAAKMVAKLRQQNTGENEILLNVSKTGGHGGGTRRFDGFLEQAREYAFVIDLFIKKSRIF